MARLENTEFVCIDCETTGLNPSQDKVIEVAIQVFTLNEVLFEFESLIDPECPIPPSSTEIHHISDAMCAGKPKIHEVIPRLLELIGRRIIVGHGVGFDIDIIAIAATQASIEHTLKQNRVIDTLRLARSYGESPINSLEQLRKHFNIAEEGAHRAMSDVIVNVGVFKYLVKRYQTTDQVFDLLSKPIEFKIMPLGKHKGRLLKEIPLEYLLWAARKDFDQDLLFSLRSEIKRRKKGNLFTQASNPFANL